MPCCCRRIIFKQKKQFSLVMKNILLLLIIIILLSCSAVASDGLFGKAKVGTPHLSLDYLGTSTEFRGCRANVAVTIEDYFEINFISLAANYDGHKLGVSANSVLNVISGVGYFVKRSDYFIFPLLLHFLTNPTFKYPLVKERIEVVAGVKTDFYVFNDEPCVYSEGSVGLRGQIDKFGLEANVSKPFAKGYLADNSAYIGLRLFYYLK